MKKTIVVLLLMMAMLAGTASVAAAGGDQVRGELGQGEVRQVQVMDPPPFQP